MLSYDAVPDKQDYLLTEKIRLKLRIENQGPEAVEFPDPQHPASDQPTIGIIGPAFPKGKLFSNLTALREASGDPLLAPAVTRVRIEPGAVWEGSAAITPVVKISEPGEYQVRSALLYQGGRADSKQAKLQVHPVAPSSVQLGMGVRPFQAASGEAVFVQSGGNSAGIYAFRFDETRPDISEMETERPIHRATVSASATDAAAPWRNVPFFNELLRWIVWREGHSIKALSSVMSAPLSQDLALEPAYLVRPPLKTTGGPVEVLAMSGNHEELSLVEFSSGPVGQDPTAKVAWKGRLPGVATGITAALAPVSQQSARHVAFTVQRKSGFDIFHSLYTQAGGLGAFQSVHVETGRLLASAPLALLVDGAGHAKVGALAVPDEPAHACTLVEAEFDGSGKPVGNARLSNFSLDGPAASGAVLYSQNEGGPVRLDVVVAVEGKALVHLNGSHKLVPVSVQGRPTNPIQLAPGQQVTYVLYTDAKRGLYFEAL
jgi:hypothetical protein